MNKLLVVGAALLLSGGGYLAYNSINQEDQPEDTAGTPNSASSQPVESAPDTAFSFADPKKAAHYVSNSPAHGSVLANTPPAVSITFNFDLADRSTVTVTKDGQDVSTGSAAVSADKLTLSKNLAGDGGSGLYTVMYSACWPDGSCHDGQFQFGVK